MLSAETVAPVTMLTQDDIERSGADSLGKVLQSLPMNTGLQVNTNQDGGVGATRVNLRGLGSERTLVLLNGRRFPNGGIGGDASVDLGMIPLSSIERIEVLPSGASAIYGSDAIGGVVNIITRRRQGGTVAGVWKITDYGDGQVATGEANVDLNVLGGWWNLGVEYRKQDGVFNASRGFSARPLLIADSEGTLIYGGFDTVPDGLFEVPAGNLLGLAPGRYTRVAGSTGQTAADYRPFTPEDSYNNSPWNYSQMPNEHFSVWMNGSRPIGEATEFFMETLVDQRHSAGQGTPDAYRSSVNFAPTLSDGTPGIPADNFYNPFGVDLPYVTRRFIEQGARRITQEVDMWRAVLGLRGSLDAWNWEISIGDSESDAAHRGTGSFAWARYEAALGPSGPDDTGRIVCGQRDPATGRVPATNVIPGCVPLDVFGGAGTITQEQLDYMVPRPLVDLGSNDQRFATAVLRGPWGRMLDRDLQWVFGAEYRREGSSVIVDPLFELEFQEPNPLEVHNEFDVKELFAEANVPLLHGQRAARDLSLTVGSRWSSDNTSWQTGLNWRPVAELTLRANYGTVFRLANVLERYESRGIESGFALDPCGNDPTPEQQANCEASGVPGGVYVQGDEEFGVITGGNPELDPESGHSLVFGFTYRPAWIPGLTTSIDFTETRLTNVIGVAPIEDLLNECADHGTATACDAIFRNPDGSPQRVAGVYRNLGAMETSAVDLAIDWNAAVGLGELSAGLLATYLAEWDDQYFPGSPVFSHAGMLTLPRWRASGHLEWQRGPWWAGYSAEFIGSMTEEVFDNPFFGVVFNWYMRTVPSVLYHDIAGRYAFTSGLSLQIGIENLTDQDPPFVNYNVPENTDAGMYRLLGRTYRIRLVYEFK